MILRASAGKTLIAHTRRKGCRLQRVMPPHFYTLPQIHIGRISADDKWVGNAVSCPLPEESDACSIFVEWIQGERSPIAW